MTPQIISMIINAVLVAFIGIISFFLKRTLEHSEENFKKMSDKIDNQTSLIHKLETSLSNKDTRISEIEKKLETVFQLINKTIENVHKIELNMSSCQGKNCV